MRYGNQNAVRLVKTRQSSFFSSSVFELLVKRQSEGAYIATVAFTRVASLLHYYDSIIEDLIAQTTVNIQSVVCVLALYLVEKLANEINSNLSSKARH